MGNVSDYLQALEATLKDCDPLKGKVPSAAAHRTATVYKYSLLYLISSKKIKFTDPEEQFIVFMNEHPPIHHYKVANAYLQKNHKPLLNYPQTAWQEEVQHGVH